MSGLTSTVSSNNSMVQPSASIKVDPATLPFQNGYNPVNGYGTLPPFPLGAPYPPTSPYPIAYPGMSVPTQNGACFYSDERFHVLYEREIRWTEVRKYSEFIRRFATEASHMEITKENYYDLYNMAVCLLKSVDGLDPDKFNNRKISASPSSEGQYYNVAPTFMMGGMPGANSQNPNPNGAELNEILQRKYSDSRTPPASSSNASSTPQTYDPISSQYAVTSTSAPSSSTNTPVSQPKYSQADAALYYNQSNTMGSYPLPIGSPTPPLSSVNGIPFPTSPGKDKSKNFTGEVFFDEVPEDRARKNSGTNGRQTRRNRTAYSSRSRNLHCYMCGVTETPEWRRGPQGDHTLCNACGLHYAKTLKKQRKERDARKHSIDMLLNENGFAAPQLQPTLSELTNNNTPHTPPSNNTTSSPLNNSNSNSNSNIPNNISNNAIVPETNSSLTSSNTSTTNTQNSACITPPIET
eukprot:TRINITY_DN586_c0_g1_i3.p1 TRINITY_DN586_c0_g1~~TRINITY_DN586_c0_g1_i3.p1  ORF type:complete len:466 (-),score=78.87 TRINITY_DN586_c0_g1_i3:373-1770(-)